LLAPADLERRLLILLVLGALRLAAVYSLGSYLPAILGFYRPCVVPPLLWASLQGDASHDAVALFGVVYVVFVSLFARRINATLVESLRLRFENLDLVGELRNERDLAHQANLAKSRFLASASHDLRQPVHALSMFVGALRARSMDVEAQRLVDHIDGSVSAMNNLFSALLDISRLDAGVIQPRSEAFAIQPLLQRICDEYRSEAEQKGLRLMLHPCSASIRSDQVLLERVVRNIVSNAVRYTQRGRVVVGCRRGSRLSIQIFDTGSGIAREHQEHVFQEFYQIENPERDRTKGLGLGLAIVKRLTELLDHPLVFRSQLNRGSMFALG